ncbi:MAG: cobyrinate a,c-diamide synthase [Acidobacteria bacterium]|nr:cobyrinate a,c-diamide synthase [Acidobacteriota bacterium]
MTSGGLGFVSSPPRLVVAGLGGDSGKTLVSLALLRMARGFGLDTRAFKKGPDYIDAAWLTWAAGRPARNLDTFLMGVVRARQSFARHAAGAGLVVIEGNRGLYDGVDAEGTHSTAELAKALDAPVLLVVNARKVTRTIAASVLGCQAFDPDVRIEGVVLNQVNGVRHERIVRDAVESRCGVPVVGVVPRLSDGVLLHSRHLGLVPPPEHGDLTELGQRLVDQIGSRLDLTAIFDLARRAPRVGWTPEPAAHSGQGRGLRIGYVRDSAFSFYYPENLECLEAAGATLVPVSSLTAAVLPAGLHALYIGGGFPETHAATIAANRGFLDDLRQQAQSGLPIYAECGGLMLLAQTLRQTSGVSRMAGVLPCDVELCTAPQGHGYAELVVENPNPFFPVGLPLRGHEFHYSRIVPEPTPVPTVCAVRRGAGCVAGRDGVVVHNVWASYTHLHALSTPEWTLGLLGAARARATSAPETGSGPGPAQRLG